MEAPMAGVVTIVFALLLSRKLGWNADPARIPVLIATVLFAFALFFPTIAATERETGWLIAGHVATGLGAIVLVIAVLQFGRKGSGQTARAGAQKKRKAAKVATQPPPPADAPSDDAPPAPDPDDPHSGPHGETA